MISLDRLTDVAENAGTVILKYYKDGHFGATLKADNTPLTLADRAAHDLIVKELEGLDSSLPVLSEESESVSYDTRKNWTRFWLVDPLDGTKEFLKKNGEFSVNIALIDKKRPVMGVVYSPVKRIAYFASKNEGAWRKTENLSPERIHVNGSTEYPYKVITSRSHKGEEQETILKCIGEYRPIYSGSAIKFGLVAEGSADLYPRLWPSMEWDTAAGDCVLEEAGGITKSLDNHKLSYNKEELRNPYFIAAATQELINRLLCEKRSSS